jgi:hypothetical protein
VAGNAWSQLSAEGQSALDELIVHHRGKHSYGGDGLDWEERLGSFMANIDEFRVMAVQLVQNRCLTPRGTHGILEYAWSTENSPQARIPEAVWLETFGLVGYATGLESPIPAPTAALILYRGCMPETRCGLAWTEDLAKAREFADAVGAVDNVYVATVEATRVLARYNRTNERECVVDTRGLRMALVNGPELPPCRGAVEMH